MEVQWQLSQDDSEAAYPGCDSQTSFQERIRGYLVFFRKMLIKNPTIDGPSSKMFRKTLHTRDGTTSYTVLLIIAKNVPLRKEMIN